MPHHVGVRHLRLLTSALAIAVAATLAAVGPAGIAQAAAASTLTIGGPSGPVTYGHPFTVTGRLDPAVDGSVVELWSRPVGGSWGLVDNAGTDAAGQVGFSRTADRTADWQLRHVADATAGDAVSAVITVSVRAALTATWTRAAVRAKHSATIHGKVTPAGGSVRLEVRRAGAWHLVKSVPVASNGSFATTVKPKKPGFKTYRVVRSAASTYLGATDALPRLDIYLLHTYIVRTRGHIVANVAKFAASAAQTYADPRGWLRAHHRFKRVTSGGDFTLLLAQARFLPTYSKVCSTLYSCRVGRNVIINQTRWRHSSSHFTGDKAMYRTMVVNHETGHWLGRPHAFCSGPGNLAPVMQQQSKGMQGCRPNAWPLAREIRAVS
jgi:hypothetical protein